MSERRRRVFVTNASHHDISAAAEFGDLVIMSEGRLNRYAIGTMARRFKEFLDDSDPEDYLLCTGLSQMGQVAAAILAKKHGRVNFLIHQYKDRKDAYVERVLVL